MLRAASAAKSAANIQVAHSSTSRNRLEYSAITGGAACAAGDESGMRRGAPPILVHAYNARMRRPSVLWRLTIAVTVLAMSLVRVGAGAWVVPRTADGHPDLEGVWENNSATPLERPRQFADKPRLSDQELAALQRRASVLFGPNSEAVFGDALYNALLADTTPGGLGATGTYSQNWLADRYFEHRTSLIVDPADGKLPTPTPAGAKLRAAMRRSGQAADSVQGMSMQDRCIHYGFPDLFAGYMSVYRIVQSPEYVAIQMEKIHDTRIIPLDGRPHLSSTIHQYLGD